MADTPVRIGHGVAPDAAETRLAHAHVDAVRAGAGLPPLVADARLARAAAGHAAYVASTGSVSHTQEAGRSAAFTGATLADRVRLVGSRHAVHVELVSRATGRDAEAAVALLVSGIYHRIALLRDDLQTLGVGMRDHAGRRHLVLNAGAPAGAAVGGRVVIWPPDHRDAVPAAIDSDAETPDPAPDTNKVGYPVSLQVSPGDRLHVTRFELVHEASGAVVPVSLHDADRDPHLPPWAAFILPREPLARDAAYRARFAGRTGSGAEVLREWRFRTAPVALAAIASDDVRTLRFAIGGIDPSETYAVCVAGVHALGAARFESPGRFTFRVPVDGTCPGGTCPVVVSIAYDPSCRRPLASVSLDAGAVLAGLP